MFFSGYLYSLWVEHYWGIYIFISSLSGTLYICILYESLNTTAYLYICTLWVEHYLGSWDICTFVSCIWIKHYWDIYIFVLYEWNTTWDICTFVSCIWVKNYWDIYICVSSMSGTLLGYLFTCILYVWNNTKVSIYICILYEWNSIGISVCLNPLCVEHYWALNLYI